MKIFNVFYIANFNVSQLSAIESHFAVAASSVTMLMTKMKYFTVFCIANFNVSQLSAIESHLAVVDSSLTMLITKAIYVLESHFAVVQKCTFCLR